MPGTWLRECLLEGVSGSAVTCGQTTIEHASGGGSVLSPRCRLPITRKLPPAPTLFAPGSTAQRAAHGNLRTLWEVGRSRVVSEGRIKEIEYRGLRASQVRSADGTNLTERLQEGSELWMSGPTPAGSHRRLSARHSR